MLENLLAKLNPEQARAVTHNEGPLMIVAGAGTGKTMVITHRIAWLIEQGLAKPEEILALTFTDKAAGEMEERVDKLLPYGYVELQISTFHAFAERLLRDHGVEIGLSRDFRVVSELDAWLLARKHFDRFKLDYFRPLGNPTKYIRSFLTHFSRAKDVGVGPEQYLAYVEERKANLDAAQADDEATGELKRLEELAGAYSTFQQVLLEHDSLDFGDLMLYTLKLLKDRSGVRDKIRARFKYVLVDEFQDTNDAQYEIVREIAMPRNNLNVVGDDDQAIYRFRGASLENILRFETDYPKATKVVLTSNYRSAQNILDAAHGFIQHNNPNRLEASASALCKKLIAQRSLTGEIEHIHCSTSEDEVSSVVKKILELREKEPCAEWNDFAILVRSNASGADFAVALERHGIPYQFLALSGLYTKLVILNMLALMRIIDNPFDSPSFYRLLTSAIVGLDERAILEINHVANRKGKSLFEVCERDGMVSELVEGDRIQIRKLLSKIIEFQRVAKTRHVAELFVLLAKDSGYLERLNQQSERQKMESFGYLQQFYERLKSFERSHEHPILHNFLIEFSHERDAGEEGSLNVDLDAGPDLVRIMTIHASKGLEFRYVFVANLVAQKFPTRAMRDAIELPEGLGPKATDGSDAHIEEERRLFYVAMTRAKEGLFFTSAEDYGGTRKRKISQFLQELGIEQPTARGQIIINLLDTDTAAPDETQPQIPLPKQFSFTQLAAFNACPLQYKFAHILKVPVMGKWTFSFGKTMHNTLEHFFRTWLERVGSRQGSLFDLTSNQIKDGLPVSLDELFEYYQVCWQDDWFTDDKEREKYRAQGRESLRSLYRRWVENSPTPLFIEQGFTLKLGEVVLKGRIDRIDAFEEGVEIIDYKTGSPKSELLKEDKEQLLLYQLAARDVLGMNPKRLTYHYLQDNSCASFLGSADELLDFQETMIQRASAIRASKFIQTPGFHCKYCDFAGICEFRV